MVEGISIDWHGLEGKEGDTLVEEMGASLRRYLGKHKGKRFVVMISYRPASVR